MGILRSIFQRMVYETPYRQALSEKAAAEEQTVQLKQDLCDFEARLSIAEDKRKSAEKNKLFFTSAESRGELLKEMLMAGEKVFDRVNGVEICLADRHSTIYELVHTISVNDADFRRCDFTKAQFDNIQFRNVAFRDVIFKDAYFGEVNFDNCTFHNCEWDGVDGYDVGFNNCKASGNEPFELDFPKPEPLDEKTQADIDRYIYEASHPEMYDEDDWECGIEFD